MIKIMVRYCGGCNPQIDRAKAIRSVAKRLRDRGYKASILLSEINHPDLILLVNGCIHGCLEEEYNSKEGDPAIIVIKGEMVDDIYVKEEEIPKLLIRRIDHILKKVD